MVDDYDNYYHYDIISKTVRTGFGSIIVIRICEYVLQQPPRACLPFLLFLLFSRRPKMIIKVIKKNSSNFLFLTTDERALRQ